MLVGVESIFSGADFGNVKRSQKYRVGQRGRKGGLKSKVMNPQWRSKKHRN